MAVRDESVTRTAEFPECVERPFGIADSLDCGLDVVIDGNTPVDGGVRLPDVNTSQVDDGLDVRVREQRLVAIGEYQRVDVEHPSVGCHPLDSLERNPPAVERFQKLLAGFDVVGTPRLVQFSDGRFVSFLYQFLRKFEIDLVRVNCILTGRSGTEEALELFVCYRFLCHLFFLGASLEAY